jgi:acetoin utilization deacetylase AcuC-like enzyme
LVQKDEGATQHCCAHADTNWLSLKFMRCETFSSLQFMEEEIMSRTAFISHPDCLDHIPPMGHPEAPARLQAVWAALTGPEFGQIIRIDAPLGRDEDIARVHPASQIAKVAALCPSDEQRPVALDADTYMSAGTLLAARRGVGAVIAGIDGVMTGQFERAFCATRPPGHHAESTTPMGFCIWNSAAIGALYARAAYGLRRVAVVDFDVHHGNGSQELAFKDPDFFYASIHQGGIYPGSGFAHETASGNLVNVPLPDGTKGQAWRAAIAESVLPALSAFGPEIIIVSAGFDGHRLDPLASFSLDEADYYWVTQELLRLAGGKLVSTLEGGYHLAALGASVAQHVQAMVDYDADAQTNMLGA